MPLLWQQSPVKLACGDVALDEAVELTELWSRILEQESVFIADAGRIQFGIKALPW